MAHRLEFLDRKVVTIKGRGWSLTDCVVFYPSHRQPHVYQEDGKKKGYYEQWVKKINEEFIYTKFWTFTMMYLSVGNNKPVWADVV